MSKIKLKIKDINQLKSILDQIETNIDPGIELIVDIKESKELMSFLCSSSDIEDWDYYKSTEKEEYKITKEDKPEEEVISGFFGDLGIKEQYDWNGVAWAIEAIHNLSKKSPALRFKSDFWNKAIKQELEKTASPHHAILTLATHSYYSQYRWEDIEEDLETKLNNLWSNMGSMTLTELAKKLYKE